MTQQLPPGEVDAELEELLAHQARFLAGGEAPAATVRRRAPPAGAAGSASASAAAPPPAAEARGAPARYAVVEPPPPDAAAAAAAAREGPASFRPRGDALLRGHAAVGAAADLSSLDELPAAPAATAVRMPRRGAAGAPPAGGAAAAASAAAPPAAAAGAPPRAAAPPGGGPPPPPAPGGAEDAAGNVLGEVRERATGAPVMPCAPLATLRGGALSAPRGRFAPQQPPRAQQQPVRSSAPHLTPDAAACNACGALTHACVYPCFSAGACCGCGGAAARRCVRRR
jgi:Meckel syndrome type 1 protein